MRNTILILLALTLSVSSFAVGTDSVKVLFAYKVADLDAASQQSIDAFIHNYLNASGVNISVYGYADYVGGAAYNKGLSQQRANNVRDYLVKAGFKKSNIKVCIGKGQIDHATETDPAGVAEDRKVVIAISRKEQDISKLKTNETLVLDNIYFKAGSHQVLEGSRPEMEKLYSTLKKHPKIKIRIEGHICCITPEQQQFKSASAEQFIDGYDYDTQTDKLSTNRAKEIYDYLVTSGIDSTRLSYKGFGATRKLVEENTEEDKVKNRRVEIRIMEK